MSSLRTMTDGLIRALLQRERHGAALSFEMFNSARRRSPVRAAAPQRVWLILPCSGPENGAARRGIGNHHVTTQFLSLIRVSIPREGAFSSPGGLFDEGKFRLIKIAFLQGVVRRVNRVLVCRSLAFRIHYNRVHLTAKAEFSQPWLAANLKLPRTGVYAVHCWLNCRRAAIPLWNVTALLSLTHLPQTGLRAAHSLPPPTLSSLPPQVWKVA